MIGSGFHADGDLVRMEVGLVEGAFDGNLVGLVVGLVEGDFVGTKVGAFDNSTEVNVAPTNPILHIF
jgi:hypothetical protein